MRPVATDYATRSVGDHRVYVEDLKIGVGARRILRCEECGTRSTSYDEFLEIECLPGGEADA